MPCRGARGGGGGGGAGPGFSPSAVSTASHRALRVCHGEEGARARTQGASDGMSGGVVGGAWRGAALVYVPFETHVFAAGPLASHDVWVFGAFFRAESYGSLSPIFTLGFAALVTF